MRIEGSNFNPNERINDQENSELRINQQQLQRINEENNPINVNTENNENNNQEIASENESAVSGAVINSADFDFIRARVEQAQGSFNSEESLRNRSEELSQEEARDLEEMTVLRMELEPENTMLAQANVNSDVASRLLG